MKKQKVNVRHNETGKNKIGYLLDNGDAKVGLYTIWKAGSFTVNSFF